ncbi:VOC family protein [Bacillus sp. FSL M8-0256]|uniref:Lactoylglutathione lyase n=1 Tax=Bacillus safensis TaxID=561879 RepID=A0A5C0WFD2_BACIA|nr:MULTISPECIES: VOC family protein [Bacillus]KEP30294.1 glyoxalase [Bacillus safensis]MCM3368531.1 VOC family protein [Bacillus safensis]MDH6563670.1 lactoylglutathione lyase [Bacillus sp. TBS-096]MDJ0292220.1 VOC family protein [Bacillus safensis]MED0865041.1 VOC family protein [Bacillus safensis]
MKMKYTILYVNDVEASIHFYQHVLGFPIKLRVESYVEFDTGDVTLSINSRQDVKEALGLPVPEANQASHTFEIGFVVDDVEQTIASMKKKGVSIIKEPAKKPWGQTVAYVSDPDGHFIEICDAVS